MTTTDPSVQAWLDQEDRHTAQIIRKHGVYITYVIGEWSQRQTSFAYTIGLFGMGHPEVLMFGLEAGTACAVMNDVADRVKAGDDLLVGATLAFPEWAHRVFVEEVPNPGQIAFGANRFYQRPDEASVPLLQLTYDDKNRRFPWEAGYSRPSWIQPRPGEFRA